MGLWWDRFLAWWGLVERPARTTVPPPRINQRWDRGEMSRMPKSALPPKGVLPRLPEALDIDKTPTEPSDKRPTLPRHARRRPPLHDKGKP